MNINKTFTNIFTFTHTYTISSTNTNTHTNIPFIEMQCCHGLADFHCQNEFKKNLRFSGGFHSESDSINSSRWVMPAGKNPLQKPGRI